MLENHDDKDNSGMGNKYDEKKKLENQQYEKELEAKLEENVHDEKIEDENSTKESIEEKTQEYSQSEEQRNSLLDRLSSYYLVNKAYSTYDYIKHTNSIIETGLSFGENTATTAISYATPVVSPIIITVESKLHLEDKSHKILDTIDSGSATVLDYATKISTAKSELTKMPYEKVNQLLVATETLIDKFLPPSFEAVEFQFDTDAGFQKVEEPENKVNSSVPTVTSRITAIGWEVPKRLTALAHRKWQTLHLTKEQLQSFSFIMDLVQYALNLIDLAEKKNKIITVVGNGVDLLFEEKQKIQEKYSQIKDILKEKVDEFQNRSNL